MERDLGMFVGSVGSGYDIFSTQFNYFSPKIFEQFLLDNEFMGSIGSS